jgi:hypothetical protein
VFHCWLPAYCVTVGCGFCVVPCNWGANCRCRRDDHQVAITTVVGLLLADAAPNSYTIRIEPSCWCHCCCTPALTRSTVIIMITTHAYPCPIHPYLRRGIVELQKATLVTDLSTGMPVCRPRSDQEFRRSTNHS